MHTYRQPVSCPSVIISYVVIILGFIREKCKKSGEGYTVGRPTIQGHIVLRAVGPRRQHIYLFYLLKIRRAFCTILHAKIERFCPIFSPSNVALSTWNHQSIKVIVAKVIALGVHVATFRRKSMTDINSRQPEACARRAAPHPPETQGRRRCYPSPHAQRGAARGARVAGGLYAPRYPPT